MEGNLTPLGRILTKGKKIVKGKCCERRELQCQELGSEQKQTILIMFYSIGETEEIVAVGGKSCRSLSVSMYIYQG